MAKGAVFPVQFTGSKGVINCDESFQKNDVVEWHRYLRHARNNRKTVSVSCLCRPVCTEGKILRLKVSHSEATDRYWLSAWPYEGSRHAENCRFYSIWSDKYQASIYDAGVVTTGADGMFKIRLPTGLQKKEPKAPDDDNPEPVVKTSATTKRKPAMQLLGLLHFMWDQAEINVWHPAFGLKKSRGTAWLGYRLDKISGRVRIGKTLLSEVMLIPGNRDGAHSKPNLQKLRAATKNKKRMVVVSQLASWTEKTEARLNSGMLPLGLFGGFPELRIPPDARARCEASFGRELGHWRKGAKVIAIAETEPPVTTFRHVDGKPVPSTRSEVIDMALMVVSPRYIPLDSGYEAVIENKLWAEQRAFVKPLRYDGGEDVFPDFLLTDVCGEEFVPLEVFGMNTPEYLARKALKQAHYEDEFGEGRWWSWDATARDAESAIPDFPQKKK